MVLLMVNIYCLNTGVSCHVLRRPIVCQVEWRQVFPATVSVILREIQMPIIAMGHADAPISISRRKPVILNFLLCRGEVAGRVAWKRPARKRNSIVVMAHIKSHRNDPVSVVLYFRHPGPLADGRCFQHHQLAGFRLSIGNSARNMAEGIAEIAVEIPTFLASPGFGPPAPEGRRDRIPAAGPVALGACEGPMTDSIAERPAELGRGQGRRTNGQCCGASGGAFAEPLAIQFQPPVRAIPQRRRPRQTASQMKAPETKRTRCLPTRTVDDRRIVAGPNVPHATRANRHSVREGHRQSSGSSRSSSSCIATRQTRTTNLLPVGGGNSFGKSTRTGWLRLITFRIESPFNRNVHPPTIRGPRCAGSRTVEMEIIIEQGRTRGAGPKCRTALTPFHRFSSWSPIAVSGF
jgi:hypothetical protein